MCSINGFTFKNLDLIQKMNFVTKHRGPDATNVFVNEEVSLGHNRLSIIDTREVANQPMVSRNERFTLVFNGEVYNFQEIKKELTEYEFKTNGDTEVVLKGFEKWGKEIFSKLNGMYAVAIWDNQKKELILARDPQGIKPLYYTLQNKNLIFASEIKAILEHNVERVLDVNAFNAYMDVLYVPAPLTMFKNIFKLEPSTILTFSNGEINKEEIIYKSEKYLKTDAKALESIVDSAIKRQLISDRPVGVFLSGGIDSSTVLDSVSGSHGKIDTFSVSFDLGDEKLEEKFNIDANLARKTSEIYKTNHHEIKINIDDVVNSLDEVIFHLDEPISNPTVVATYILSRFAKEKVDVVLGGDGADELFAGYERYRLSLISEWYQKCVPSFLRNKLEFNKRFKKLNIKNSISKYTLFFFQDREQIKSVINTEYLNNYSIEFFKQFFIGNKNFTEQFLITDQKTWMIDESLMRSDKMSMAHSLELRVPLLDLEIVAFAHSTPLFKKLDIFRKKKILKNAFRSRLPKYLFNQPKRGWFSPSAKWMRDPKMLEIMKETLSENYYPETGKVFNWYSAQKMLNNHVEYKLYNQAILWSLFTFQIWAKKYKIKI